MEYLVLMVETRALNISWWSSQHQRVPPFGVNPGFFSFSISKGHLGSMMSAQSSQAETLQKRIPSGCFAFSPASEKDSCPEEADFLRICVTSTYPADQPNREPGSFFYPAEGSVIISSSPGGRGAGGFWGGGNHDVFRGEKMEVSRR